MLPLLVILVFHFFAEIQGNFVHIDKPSGPRKMLPYSEPPSHPCARICKKGASPMTCRYTFEVEYYYTMGRACYDCPFNVTDCYRPGCIPAEGSKRGAVSVNRQIPGPAIEVCLGDRIVVDVVNKMTSESTTMHWHGIHQKETPYADGVPYVAQCPTLPYDTFRYSFDALQAGTHWYHSHIGMQRADGDFGPMVIRIPDEDNVLAGFYDYDLSSHIISICDWDDSLSLERYLGHVNSDGGNKPKSIIINGLGRNKEFEKDGKIIHMPTARFFVDQGYRYRFRVLNSGVMNCPLELSIDNHTFTLISTDGNDVMPVEAKSLIIFSGERFDIIVEANQMDDLYWIRVKGLQDCGPDYNKVFQLAVLHYTGADATLENHPKEVVDYENAHLEGLQINSITGESSENFLSIPDLQAIQEWDESLKEKPDFKYIISFDFEAINNSDFQSKPNLRFNNLDVERKRKTPQLNHISLKMPNFALLPSRNQVSDDIFCNKENMVDQNCTVEECKCYHAVKIPLNATVELIFIDEAAGSVGNHPMHLHGFNFRVVGMEKIGDSVTPEEIESRDKLGLLKRNLVDAPLKDTVNVPAGGYTIVRFQASNPGYWILHCHLEFHAELGMSMLLQVGEKEDMVPVPDNFPSCGDYTPDW
ncbi:uncharacterized protein [Leptinotarsa decemlineata]|nr:laccase-2-like [Leptinotarsa decemlineata]